MMACRAATNEDPGDGVAGEPPMKRTALTVSATRAPIARASAPIDTGWNLAYILTELAAQPTPRRGRQ